MNASFKPVYRVLKYPVHFVSILALSAAVCAAAQEDEENVKGTVVKTRDGINFQVPEDWPIEKRGGVVGPIPVEEYLGIKFAKLEGRIAELEKQSAALQARLEKLESAKQNPKKLQSGEQPAALP